MAIYVERFSDNKLITVRKYIIDDNNNEWIWSNEWYGKHRIGTECNLSEGQKDKTSTESVEYPQIKTLTKLNTCPICGRLFLDVCPNCG